MRKLAKGSAIAAAILSIFAILSIVINLVTYLNNSYTTTLSYVILGLNFIGTVLLTVVLFRRKADTFAAVACFANIPGALASTIAAILSVNTFSRLLGQFPEASTFLVSNIFTLLYSLLKVAVFVLMALQCFRKDDRKNPICVILPIVVAVLIIAQAFVTLPTNYGIRLSDLSHASPYVIGMIVGAIIGTALGCLPLIFAGMAFSKIRAVDPAAVQAPLYQQYQQPQYQQYQAPQYQAPQYQAPQYQAPQYQQPQYQAPVPQEQPSQEQ